MVKLTILAGGFSTFISTYVFDSDAGSLNLVKNTPTGANPSWITLHPQNSSVLYAVNEDSPIGNLQSFLVDTEGSLTLGDTITTGGNGPTYTEVLSTGEVTGLNFGSPNIAIVPTDSKNPLKFVNSPNNLVQFPIKGGPSNPHMSLEHNGEVFVPDLGASKIWRLKKDADQYTVKGSIDFAAGNGPRHIAIQNNTLFTVHETSSRLTVQLLPATATSPTTPLIANLSTVPPPPKSGTFTAANGVSFNGTFAAAEILISEPTANFPNPFIYVSNRNLGPDLDPNGDTIAIFQFQRPTATVAEAAAAASIIVNAGSSAHSRFFSRRQTGASNGQGQLVLVAQVHTGLSQIRSMALGTGTDGADQYLIAGANTQGGVAIFQRIDGGKNLKLVARNVEVQNRTSFVFL